VRPTAAELMAGATPGFKRQPGSGPSSNGSAVGQYRRLESNFLVGNYNVNSNLETDDGSSRYLLYNNYFVFGHTSTDFAINAHCNYYVNNVYADSGQILYGWRNYPATNCYVYNATFFLRQGSRGPLCSAAATSISHDLSTAVLDTTIVHTNNSSPLGTVADCPQNGTGVTWAPSARDAAVTASAKMALGEYPKPNNA
jgi:hypothetical protein